MKLSMFNTTESVEDGLIIYNSRSGGVLGLNKEYRVKYESISRGRMEGCEDLVQQMQLGEMLVDDDCDELAQIAVLSRAARFASNTLNLTIAPTLNCNFRCPYCYEKGKKFVTMTDEVSDAVM